MPALQSPSGVHNHHSVRMTTSGFIGTFHYHYISNTIGEASTKGSVEKGNDLRGGKKLRK